MDDGKFINLYAVKCYWKVHKGGDQDLWFDVGPTNECSGWQDTEMGPLPAAVNDNINGERVNIIEALQDVVEIDDNNELACKNVPQTSDNNNQVFGEWGHTGLCYCHMQNIPNKPAKLNFPLDTTQNDIYVQLFEGLFPTTFLKMIITEMNKKFSGDPVTYGELLRWIGLWILMSTVDGSD